MQAAQPWIAAFPYVQGAVNHALACTELRDLCFEDAEQAARGVYRSRLRRPPARGELPAGAAVLFDVNHLVLTLMVARDPIAHGADEALRNIIGTRGGGSDADWTDVAQAFIAWFNAAAGPGTKKTRMVWIQGGGATAAGAWRASTRRVAFPSRRAWAVFLMFKRTWANLSGRPHFNEAELMVGTMPTSRRRVEPSAYVQSTAAATAAATHVTAVATPPSSERWADMAEDD